MTHDPLCPDSDPNRWVSKDFNGNSMSCRCEEYAKVREDERYKAELHDYHMPAWTSGYSDALDAAEAAVETWISYTFPAHRPGWTGKITAAIRALKEK